MFDTLSIELVLLVVGAALACAGLLLAVIGMWMAANAASQSARLTRHVVNLAFNHQEWEEGLRLQRLGHVGSASNREQHPDEKEKGGKPARKLGYPFSITPERKAKLEAWRDKRKAKRVASAQEV